MRLNTLFAVMIALPAMAAAQDTSETTGSINRVERQTVLNENQVRDRLEKAGYTAIGSLDRDADGVWHTTAMMGADMRAVSVGRQGSIEDR